MCGQKDGACDDSVLNRFNRSLRCCLEAKVVALEERDNLRPEGWVNFSSYFGSLEESEAIAQCTVKAAAIL